MNLHSPVFADERIENCLFFLLLFFLLQLYTLYSNDSNDTMDMEYIRSCDKW